MWNIFGWRVITWRTSDEMINFVEGKLDLLIKRRRATL
ncbi:hypothetical protein B6254_0448 [Weissella cibaria]|uniref:Uncharacterized protein n=1 Tax=Weissella cibaria TaxID=137591 RepID=A0A2S1KPE1_9LACO|nr:hypothetical protein B6254_0448 [Weissella cibaria]